MKFYVFQMKKNDAFWLQDLCLERINFQIGPMDSIELIGGASNGSIRYAIDDTKYKVEVDLTKAESRRLSKYL